MISKEHILRMRYSYSVFTIYYINYSNITSMKLFIIPQYE